MKLRIIGISILIIFFASQLKAQSIVALSTGISADLKNKKPFYAIPITFRWEPFERSGFFIEATQSFGFNRLANADAYTTSPQLPEHVSLTEAININSRSIGIGGAIVLYTNKKNNRFTLNLSIGICTEKFKVTYRNYDNENYEVVNPDVGDKRSGLYVSAAGVYNFHKRKQDMFIMLRAQSPSTGGQTDFYYPLSYHNTAPLQLTYGYKLFYNKK